MKTAPAARVLIAEDEPPMRARLREQLARAWPEAELVAEAGNGSDAWEAWLAHEPDVVFLDIRMPGMSGLDVAARIAGTAASTRRAPVRIVFVTAYDQHAVEAFDRGAVDYLLKPIQPERFALTVRRLQQAAATRPPGDLARLLAELQQGQAAPPRLTWIKASVGRRIQLIKVDEIRFFQSDTRYTRVVHAGGEALIRTPLKELLDGLDPAVFWQVHRSVVVNANAVAGAERVGSDGMELLLKDSAERLPVSRAAFHLFRE